jgi:hypothetical protein
MCQWEEKEVLSDALAREKFSPPPGSVIKVSASVHRFYRQSTGAASLHIAVVPGGDGSKATIAVGTFACCSFAVELVAGFMHLANKNAYRVSEKVTKKFRFTRGENGAKAFRVPNTSGENISAEALALVNCPVARMLVWPHFQGANDALQKIEGLLPSGESDLPRAKSAYIECQKEAAGDWKEFRRSVIKFLRARHVALCSVGNTTAGLLPGEPHPFFFSKHQAGGLGSEVRGKAERGAAAEESTEEVQVGRATGAVSSRVVHQAELASAPTSGTTTATPTTDRLRHSRYEVFCDVLLRNTRCPFEISLPHIVQKVNDSEGCDFFFEESEATSHLRRMTASKLGISMSSNGKVLRR